MCTCHPGAAKDRENPWSSSSQIIWSNQFSKGSCLYKLYGERYWHRPPALAHLHTHPHILAQMCTLWIPTHACMPHPTESGGKLISTRDQLVLGDWKTLRENTFRSIPAQGPLGMVCSTFCQRPGEGKRGQYQEPVCSGRVTENFEQL